MFAQFMDKANGDCPDFLVLQKSDDVDIELRQIFMYNLTINFCIRFGSVCALRKFTFLCSVCNFDQRKINVGNDALLVDIWR